MISVQHCLLCFHPRTPFPQEAAVAIEIAIVGCHRATKTENGAVRNCLGAVALEVVVSAWFGDIRAFKVSGRTLFEAARALKMLALPCLVIAEKLLRASGSEPQVRIAVQRNVLLLELGFVFWPLLLLSILARWLNLARGVRNAGWT